MIVGVILGNNMDTPMWIRNLKYNLSDSICVIDYDYYGEPTMINGVMFVSNIDAKKYLKNFDSMCFYKSFYIYLGMQILRSSNKANEKSN